MNFTRWIALLATSSLILMAAPATASISSTTPFSIQWTAPGDDSLIGRAALYDLRCSDLPITAENFYRATRVLGVSAPGVAGTLESFVVSGLSDGMAYLAIKSSDEFGNWSSISNLLTRSGGRTAAVAPPTSFSASWPNPARVSAQWAYSMSQDARIEVDVFDVLGRHVHAVAGEERKAGRGNVFWDLNDDRGTPVGSGVYIVKARIGAMAWTKRLTVVR